MGSGIYSLGTRAMFASQAMLDTTAHNISNVNTPGYSRQQVELATEGGMYTGAGFFGRGVRIATVTRSTNEFLIKEANVNTAASASDQTRLGKLEQLEKILPTGQNGLGYAATQFLNTFVDVSNQPQDMSARQVTLSRAQEWANRVNTAAKQLDQQQAGVIMDMQTSVSQVNSLTQKIAGLNQQIAVYNGSGHTANDLLDQRDNLIKDLNKLVQVNTVEADDGSLSVFMGGGQVLVLSNTAQTLQVERDALDATKGRVALVTNGTSRVLDSGQITGGALQGLLRYQDEDLTSTRAELNNFVAEFANKVNEIHSYGQTPDGAYGDPIFSNTDSPSTLRVNLSNPKDLAAASPLIAYTSTANTGTVSVGGVTMTGTLSTATPATALPLTINFVADATAASGIRYDIVDSGGTALVSSAWVAGPPLDGSSLNPPFNLNLNGAPAAGDSVTMQAINASTLPGNNGNALSMLALRDHQFTGLGGATVTDAYAEMIGNLGVKVQDGRIAASISKTLEDSSNQTLSSTAGVNLDEEASRLIQFQQSYQAAAKVLQVAQTVFDTLLNITR